MNWYEDPAGVVAKITAAITAVVTLVTALIALYRGVGTVDAALAAVAPAVAGVLAVLAIRRGRQDSIAPKTVIENADVALASAERSKNAYG